MRFAIIAAAALGFAACQEGAAPDIIFFGGTIYTGLKNQPTAEAVSVKDGKILAVGKADALTRTANAATKLENLKGAFLYPGFTDAHAHLYGIGEREMTLNLDEVKSINELAMVVAEAAKAQPTGSALHGRGWIETHWPEQRFPNRADIDPVTGDRPAVLVRADGHALLVNTAALKAAGIEGKPKAQPDGGRIEVDKQGLPTGMLIDNAMALVAGLAAKPTPDEINQAFVKGAEREARLGWTGVHSMSVEAADVPVIDALSKAGRLPIRIYNAVDVRADFDPNSVTFEKSQSPLVTTRAIKLYMDGALGSRGALLFAPYSDAPEITGLARSHEEETLAILKRAYDAGIQVSFHAIGDKGNATVLDWMERTFATEPVAARAKRDPRWRIEHAQILRPEDIARFKADGIIPSMQPSHAIGDLYFAPARLGQDRLKGAYAWRSLIDAGSIIAGGSDAPVEQGDPRIEFYAAVARKDLKGGSGPDWRPDQKVTREEALKMFTLWPAYASFRENELGTIEPGKEADFTGFTKDIMTVPESEILTAATVITVVGGAVTYKRPATS